MFRGHPSLIAAAIRATSRWSLRLIALCICGEACIDSKAAIFTLLQPFTRAIGGAVIHDQQLQRQAFLHVITAARLGVLDCRAGGQALERGLLAWASTDETQSGNHGIAFLQGIKTETSGALDSCNNRHGVT